MKLNIKPRHLQTIALLVIVGVTVILTLWITRQVEDEVSLSQVKASVGKLMILPKDEEPTLAVVESKNELQDNYLKSVAEKGDQLLIYSTLGQVIIYRPNINKIVAVSTVTVDAAQAQANGATIEIRNGTNDGSIADELKDELIGKYPTAKLSVTVANNKEASQTIVIDNNDTKDNLFVQIVDYLKASRGVVPLGEAKATTDIVIIIGKDYLETKRI